MQHFIANAGTPLLWAMTLHLSIGNLLIGALEAGILRWRFNASWWAFAWMIAANYLSAFAGLYALPPFVRLLEQSVLTGPPVHTLIPVLVASAIFSLFLSCLLEWVFVWRSLGVQRRWSRALRATLVVNAASYLLLVPVYLFSSDLSGVLQNRLVQASEMTAGLGGWVYYVDASDKQVRRVSLGRSADEVVVELSAELTSQKPRIFALARRSEGGFDLYVTGTSWGVAEPGPDARLLIENFAAHAGALGVEGSPAERPNIAVDMRDSTVAGQRTSDAGTNVWWPFFGFSRLNGEETRYINVETPIHEWRHHAMTVLPGDLVVVESEGQVLVWDPKDQRLAFLALGFSPVVVLQPRMK